MTSRRRPAPRQRHQRLGGIDDRARVPAVGVGPPSARSAPQPKAARGDVGDAGPERAGDARSSRTPRRWDLVGDVAHRPRRRSQREAEQAFLFGDVEQFVLGAVAAAFRRRNDRPAGSPASIRQAGYATSLPRVGRSTICDTSSARNWPERPGRRAPRHPRRFPRNRRRKAPAIGSAAAPADHVQLRTCPSAARRQSSGGQEDGGDQRADVRSHAFPRVRTAGYCGASGVRPGESCHRPGLSEGSNHNADDAGTPVRSPRGARRGLAHRGFQRTPAEFVERAVGRTCTSTTSPPGTCTIRTWQRWPARTLSGRIHWRSIYRQRLSPTPYASSRHPHPACRAAGRCSTGGRARPPAATGAARPAPGLARLLDLLADLCDALFLQALGLFLLAGFQFGLVRAGDGSPPARAHLRDTGRQAIALRPPGPGAPVPAPAAAGPQAAPAAAPRPGSAARLDDRLRRHPGRLAQGPLHRRAEVARVDQVGLPITSPRAQPPAGWAGSTASRRTSARTAPHAGRGPAASRPGIGARLPHRPGSLRLGAVGRRAHQPARLTLASRWSRVNTSYTVW